MQSMCLIVFPSWGQEGWTIYILAFLNHQLRSETWSGKWSEVAQLRPTLWDPMDHDCHPMDDRLPGSAVHGSLQARILACISILFSRGSSWLRDQTRVSHISSRLLYPSESPWKPWPGFSLSYQLRVENRSGKGVINSLGPPHEVHVRAALPLEKAQAKRCRG